MWLFVTNKKDSEVDCMIFVLEVDSVIGFTLLMKLNSDPNFRKAKSTPTICYIMHSRNNLVK